MDNNPPSSPASQQDASPAPRSSSPLSAMQEDSTLAEDRRETALSRLAEIFGGPDGLYPGARWLIYIAMAFILFGLFTALIDGLSSRRKFQCGEGA